jgi:hypothetical protein
VLRALANLGAEAAHVTHRPFVMRVVDRGWDVLPTANSLNIADCLNSLRKLDFPHLAYVRKALVRQATSLNADANTADTLTSLASTLRAGHHFGCLEPSLSEALLDRVAELPPNALASGTQAAAALFAIATVRTWHEPAVRRLLQAIRADVKRIPDTQLVRALWSIAAFELYRQESNEGMTTLEALCHEIGQVRGGFPSEPSIVELATEAVEKMTSDHSCSAAARAALQLVV